MPTCIETARLIISTASPDDAEALAAFASRNRAHFAPTSPKLADDHFTAAFSFWHRRIAAAIEEAAQGRS